MNEAQRDYPRGTLRSFRHDVLAATLLVLAGAAVRLVLRDLPNFAPVAGIALFAGFFLQRFAIALLVPILVMVVSDQVLGGYDLVTMLTVYSMLALPVVLRPLLRRILCGNRNPSWKTGVSLLGMSLTASLAFFIVTNFSVWAWSVYGDSPMALYEASLSGLVSCYLQALPFFRYTLAGDLCFSLSLFGGWALVMQRIESAHAVSLIRSKS